MGIIEIRGGRVTLKSLMNKTKSDLAYELLMVLGKIDEVTAEGHEWDGHTANDVLQRLHDFIAS